LILHTSGVLHLISSAVLGFGCIPFNNWT
jgi:hypothetical protein